MKIYAIGSAERHSRNREHTYHEYTLVQLARVGEDLFWVPCEDRALAQEFKYETPLLSLETIQKKYHYTYVGLLKYGRRPYKDGDLEFNPEL